MSSYFQSLIQQSNLHLTERPVAPVLSVMPHSEPVKPAPATGTELVEIQEEIPSLPAAENRLLAKPAPTASQTAASFNPPPAAEASTASASLPSNAPATDFVIHEQVEFVTRPSAVTVTAAPGKKASHESVHIDRPTSSTLQPAPNTTIPTAEGIPTDLMQAVMRWIGDGQPTSATGNQNSAKRESNETSSSPVQIETTVPAKETSPVVPTSIPERVIEIIEEHFESAPPVAEPVSFPRTTAPRTSPPAARTPQTSSADPIQVSIGSINVRIETPPVAPAIVHAPRSEPSRATPASRSSNFSKLRRHYILPH